jgi:tetrahydromethanopterin S-methyltransferase subunit G
MNYDSMSKDELESTLKRLKSNLEDLEETITFNFSHTSDHIGGKQVRKDEGILRELKEEIEKVKKILSKL